MAAILPLNVLSLIREATTTEKIFIQSYYKEYAAQTVVLWTFFVGWPGAAHNARVWLNSSIFHKISISADLLMPDSTHILADSAYPLSVFLMCPYRDNGHLTNIQNKFNVTLSSSRVVIEQAFGMLNGRFRRLKYLDMMDITLASRVITASCILHNLCIDLCDETGSG